MRVRVRGRGRVRVRVRVRRERHQSARHLARQHAVPQRGGAL